ncbi:MAG: hypothetical protein NC311_05660 [Muribaculaceae bacterium]|nr:hypothetical protein [Muribaculaceae bacterium]
MTYTHSDGEVTIMNKTQKGYGNVSAQAAGIYEPVTLVPRDSNPQAMLFSTDSFPSNVTDIIAWLGNSFYALTTGREIKIQGAKISREIDPNAESTLDNLVIVIDNSNDGTDLVVVVPGNWIVWQERTGYRVLTQEQVDEGWTYTNV